MRYLILLFASIAFIVMSCDKEDWNHSSDFQLEFSLDTLSFDTLFTGIGSTTLQVKVYNKSSGSVRIDRLGLANEEVSDFRLNINGQEADQLSDITLKSKDSLFIFVETTPEFRDQDLPFLLKDSIVFDFNGKRQDIKLRAWGQDIHLLKDQHLKSQTWTANRPYLIYGDLVLEENESLELEPGTRVYFHKGAEFQVKGSLKALGSLEHPIYMQGDRLEDLYDYVPGQWEGIRFEDGSRENVVEHLVLKNGKYGMILHSESPEMPVDIKLRATQVMNMTQVGIGLRNARLEGDNLLLANCGQQLLLLEESGAVEIYHSTLANYWGFSFRSESALEVRSSELNSSGALRSFKMGNCILYGSSGNELLLDTGEQNWEFGFQNCLLRMGSGSLAQDSEIFTDCIFNLSPEFTGKADLDFRLTSSSPARDAGAITIGALYPLDLSGNGRTLDGIPDIGAFEFKDEE